MTSKGHRKAFRRAVRLAVAKRGLRHEAMPTGSVQVGRCGVWSMSFVSIETLRSPWHVEILTHDSWGIAHRRLIFRVSHSAFNTPTRQWGLSSDQLVAHATRATTRSKQKRYCLMPLLKCRRVAMRCREIAHAVSVSHPLRRNDRRCFDT